MKKRSAETKGRNGSLENEYLVMLREYLSDAGESGLGKAYNYGRRAITQEKSLVELVSLHHEALERLLQGCKSKEAEEKVIRGSANFFAECLSSYEMAYRGFRESVQALRQLNETLEEEIKRIAYSVHDEAGQLLVAVHLALADVKSEATRQQNEKIDRVEQLLAQVEKELRRYSHELRPTILDDLGWVPAVRFLADRISKKASLPIHIDTAVSGRLPAAAEVTLYRVVQEALTNSTKHAQAKNVWIRAWQEELTLHCSIKDDGIGFNSRKDGKTPGQKGLGLIAMRERVTAIGGTLSIVSNPQQGTELSIRLPLEVRHAH